MEKKFEICLYITPNSDCYHSYDWMEIPVVGDKLIISKDEIFVVEERLLPTTFSFLNRIILYGKIL